MADADGSEEEDNYGVIQDFEGTGDNVRQHAHAVEEVEIYFEMGDAIPDDDDGEGLAEGIADMASKRQSVCDATASGPQMMRRLLRLVREADSAGTALPNLKATLVEEFGALAFQVNRTMLLAELHRLHLHREERVQQVNGEAKPMNEKLLQLKRIAAQKMLFDKLSKRAQTASMSDEDEDEDVKVFSEDPQYAESAESYDTGYQDPAVVYNAIDTFTTDLDHEDGDAFLQSLIKANDDDLAAVDLDTSHLKAKIVSFKREGKRNRLNMKVSLGKGITWNVYKYYTDFALLQKDIGKSALKETLDEATFKRIQDELPPKHSKMLKMKMKMSSSGKAVAKEMEFMKQRVIKLNGWLDVILAAHTAKAICEEMILDEFFEAYWQLRPKATPADAKN